MENIHSLEGSPEVSLCPAPNFCSNLQTFSCGYYSNLWTSTRIALPSSGNLRSNFLNFHLAVHCPPGEKKLKISDGSSQIAKKNFSSLSARIPLIYKTLIKLLFEWARVSSMPQYRALQQKPQLVLLKNRKFLAQSSRTFDPSPTSPVPWKLNCFSDMCEGSEKTKSLYGLY